MTFYPIVQKNSTAAASCGYRRRLPTFYMEDFSVIGLRVSDRARAIEILARHAYPIHRANDNLEIGIASPPEMMSAVRLLNENGLRCELADIAEDMYQG